MPRKQSARFAFSLMELLAVVTILGIIAALVIPRLVSGGDKAKDKTCLHNRAELNISVERYYMHNGAWPADDLSDIAGDVDYFPEGIPLCPVSGAPYRLDPATHRVLGHDAGDHNP